MLCKDKLYHSTDIVMKLPIEKGFSVADVAAVGADLEVVLTHQKNSQPPVTKTKSGGHITIVDGEIFMKLKKADITIAGFFLIKITLTKADGDVVGVRPCPNHLKFYSQ